MQTFKFDFLKAGRLGLSPVYGSALTEAAAYCLHKNGHRSPRTLSLVLKTTTKASLLWVEVGPELDATWTDLKEAVEYAAYAVAIIVSVEITKFRRVERCAQSGTGIDFWLTSATDDRGIFQNSARLEVSGILKGGSSAIEARLRQKINQTKSSDETTLPVYIVIVEFGSPVIRMHKRLGDVR